MLALIVIVLCLWLVGFSEGLLWIGVPVLSAIIVAALLH
jgi:hypothetical protein